MAIAAQQKFMDRLQQLVKLISREGANRKKKVFVVTASMQTVCFLADRTNGRAYATALCLSVVCNVCIVAKWCILPKNCLKKQIGNGLRGNE